MKNQYEEMKEQLVKIAQKAYREKLMAGTSGNMSIFCPDQGHLIITPSGYDYEIMEQKDVVVIDLDGYVIEGIHMPSNEWRMHAEIYRHVPRVGAIVHTHSPYATSFAVLHKEIPQTLIEMGVFLKGSVEVSPYAQQGSAQVGMNAVPILSRKNACLMANHGVLAVGSTLEEAYINSVYVEDAAKIYHMACCVGTPVIIED